VHGASAQKVEVDVIDLLAAFRIAVGHKPEAPFGDTFFIGDFIGELYQVAHDMGIVFPEIKDSGNMFFRDYEGMDRRLRIDVFKGKGNVVFIHYF